MECHHRHYYLEEELDTLEITLCRLVIVMTSPFLFHEDLHFMLLGNGRRASASSHLTVHSDISTQRRTIKSKR